MAVTVVLGASILCAPKSRTCAIPAGASGLLKIHASFRKDLARARSEIRILSGNLGCAAAAAGSRKLA